MSLGDMHKSITVEAPPKVAKIDLRGVFTAMIELLHATIIDSSLMNYQVLVVEQCIFI